ncbi:MAG: hypothetical protein LBF88_11585 [Planctomycetaceae bacterium]|nr:hypothetical protein [Planctomycetaceae bacterium]
MIERLETLVGGLEASMVFLRDTGARYSDKEERQSSAEEASLAMGENA